MSTVESVEVAGPGLIRIRTREPDPLLASRLASVFVVPKASADAAPERPVGTGPYRFVRRTSGVVEVEAFPGHWRGRPAVDRARFVSVKPGEGTLAALRQGDVDVLRWVPEDLVDAASSIPGVRTVRHPSLRALYLWMGPGSRPAGPFSDARVRRAASLAIDRDALAKMFPAGNAPLWQFVPPLVHGHVAGLRLPSDPSLARRTIARAGHPRRFETPLIHAPGVDRLAAAVAEMLGAVGIRAVPQVMEWPDMRERWHRGELPLFLGSWRFESVEASVFLRECVSTRDPGADPSWNPGFSSARVDRMIEENFRLFDEEGRRAHFDRLWDVLAEEMPLVPLLERLDLYAVRSRVRWSPRGDGSIRVAEMSVVGESSPRDD
jgi:peptide/nickel transport system substrate-binding protein